MAERLEKNLNKFWQETCGIDTHRRGSTFARLDTPWNAFRADRSALVNTIWVDRIATVVDPRTKQSRRFVRLGITTGSAPGPAQNRRAEARTNLDAAIRDRIAIHGYEALPSPSALRNGTRSVKHFFVDRLSLLRPFIGLTRARLEEELPICAEFGLRFGETWSPGGDDSYLFELLPISEAANDESIGSDAGRDDALESQDADEASDEDMQFVERYARKALAVLVSHVLNQRDDVMIPLTYVALAGLIDRRNRHGDPWARGMGRVLGRVTTLIEEATEHWPVAPPYLTTIVVLATGVNRGLPDDGLTHRWPDYASLTREQKRAKVQAEYDRILALGSGWTSILASLGIPLLVPSSNGGQPRLGGWGGGESEAHRALKRFVLEHPEQFGAGSGAAWTNREEFALFSGDEIDVFFESPDMWVGVEVKSCASDLRPDDYQRGIYQVVKYRAVLEAQALAEAHRRGVKDATVPTVHVVLVLEGKLPDEYRELAQMLRVDVRERVAPRPWVANTV